MGIYEDLLKRKKIIEDEQGNVTVNSVVDKNIRSQLTNNNIQTYNRENTNNAINQMKNILTKTAGNTIWEQMQNIITNKPANTSNIVNGFFNNLNRSIEDEKSPTTKNKNIIEDTKGLAKLIGFGAVTGSKNAINYIEKANENNFKEYEKLKKNQFITSTNISEEDKAKAKIQNNLLLNSKGIKANEEDKTETNLVKKAIKESIYKDNQKIQEEQAKMSNAVTGKLGEIAPSMGQMIPGTVLSAVNPYLGTAYFTTSSGGSYIDDALNRGMNEEQAFKYGTVMGVLEGVSETAITGQQLNKVSKAFTGKEISKKILESYGFNIFENAVQEAVMEPAQEITAGIIGDKADWSNMGSRMLESGFNGALMGAISNGVTFGLEKSGNVYNKIKNGEIITETEYREALQENIDKFGKEAVENAMKNGATEVYQEINNLQQQSTQNEKNIPTQQITQEQNKTAQNGNMEQILPTQNYYYKKSKNTKIDNLRKDASRYFDNSEKTHNFINMLEQIIQDKDIDIRLDENLTDTKGDFANGKYQDGIITINPNSNRAGEFIAIHELSHAIGTDSMRNIIKNYRKSNAEFDNAVKSLLENYNTTELTDEAMADVSAQLFGNQEYINNLAQTNSSLFKKIYNEIKYLWHQFRSYKNQNQFIEDLQYKWEQAYRNNNKLNEKTNYSIAGRKSLENIKNDTNSYNTGINSYNQAQALAKQNIDNEQIRQQTGWFRDKNGAWKYEISDKDMAIKNNINLEIGKSYKLNNLLKHDTLFTLYPSLKSIDVDIVDKNGARGSYNNKIITLNMRNLKNQKITEATLIHEIQHAIQDIEEFETGTTSKLSKKTYFENLGEIEAEDVSKRFVDEKYKKANINVIAPESSKSNPKHRYYDEYMKNRGTVDKIKDSVFKYSKKDGSSDAINQEYLEQNNEENLQNDNEEVWNRLEKEDSEKSSFNLPKNKQARLDELKSIDTSNIGFIERGKIRTEIRALEQGYNSIEEYKKAEQGKVQQAKKEYEQRQKEREHKKIQKQIQLEKDIKESTPLQNAQFQIIQKTNPMLDDYHTGIRSPKDIKTFDEVVNDEESFGWGDYSKEDALRDLKRNKVKIYSSYPIKNGVFISTSYQQALDYAGGDRSKVHSREVSPEKVAWINGDEGQYANISSKYSLPTKDWQEYLDDNIESKGTRTNFKDIKLPTKENVNNNTITNNYAQNNENNTQNKVNPTRHEVIKNNREIARENIKNISTWKDKKRGLSYQLETMERNMFDIIPDKEEAQRINDTYFNPIHESEAQKQKFINSYNDKIKELKLNKYESEAVQFLGEKKYNPDFNKGDGESLNQRDEIQKRIDSNIKNGKIDIDKVNNAIETFRNIYDELFELENDALKENGYKEKPYRKGYFPHFIDYLPETRTEKVLNKLGFKIDKRPLPTDIAGITEQFVPGKTWNKSSLERKGNKTDYNALKGFDTYIAQASDNIFHTDNIQRLRGLENEIRYQYSDKGVQERIDNILNDETLYEDEKQNLIDQILEQTNNPMPNLVTELRRYTNALANKKSEADRSIENMMGRSVYSTVNAIENRFGANAVGLNIGSAVTNFIPITQAWSQVSTKNMGRAVIDTVKSYINDDGFVDNSAFLTSRVGQSEKLYKTSIEKISDKTSILFNAIDEVTSNIVVRSKYLENIKNGMSESEAIKNADQFARNVIADRSKGALPTKFEEKNPITKAFTQFQLEVNNQYRYMFKDIPRDLKEKGLGSIALAFFKMFVGAWLYNNLSEEITGRRPAFDPIDIATSAYKDITDEKKGTYDKITSIGKNVTEELPFVGGLVGGGRIPVNGAIPDAGNLTKAGVGLATGEMDSKKAISNIGKEVAKPLYYLLPPFGGAQIKKSVEGISTVANGGSYGVDSKGREILQFPVENANAVDYVKAGVFGKYALPLAKEYTDNNFKSLNANQTKTYKESKIPYKEYLEYLNQGLKKNEEKIDYISKQNWGENQKWGIYTNEIFSDTERKEGGSQLEDAQYAIKNGTSKTEYMKLYNEANKRSMSLPTQEEYKELKEKGISLKSFTDYQFKVHDETKRQKADGKLEEDKQLKNKDKIEILINSNYSDSEKEAIYKKSINSQDKKIQVVDELGLPITQYLKYRQQDFVNDKDSDGETISGTKKQKVYNYLNSISDSKLSQDYKKLICKIEGITSYDSDVARFVVNKDNLTADKKKEILKILGFKVDKNGNISTTTMITKSKTVK